MKKLLIWAAVLLTAAGFALAEETSVFVSITNGAGEIVMAHENIAVNDSDGDGICTIHDALICAHTAKYAGEEGYLAEKTEYGMSLVRLWGEENYGSFGYYLNHQSAWSLLDEVKTGDCVKVYAFTDLDTWSDTYCYFNADTVTLQPGAELTLTLYAAAFDASWNPVTLPVEGAVLTVNGERTSVVTDANGQAVLVLDAAGEYVISAVSDTQVLVPPVCTAAVGSK